MHQSRAYLGAIDTTVTFGEAVRFSDVHRGDTIDLPEGKTFFLTGPSGNMRIDVPTSNGTKLVFVVQTSHAISVHIVK